MKQLFYLTILLIGIDSCNHYENPSIPGSLAFPNNSVVLVMASVKITVGETLYENLDATIRVSGYDKANIKIWTNDYDFRGPTDTLTIRNGLHHYSIELVNKWGVNDSQSGIPGKTVWDGRADGPTPVNFVLGGAKKAKKLSKFITLREVKMPEGTIYQLESRTSYSYSSDGLLMSILNEPYNTQTAQFEQGIFEAFTYEGKSVSKITTSINGDMYAEYQYEYGSIDKIVETDYKTGIVTTQLIRRNYDTNPNDSSVSVDYSFSNGQSILYDFALQFKNIVRDRTRTSGELCNLGNYSYDKNINPFHHLGYTDFDLKNWSASNKLSQRIDYYACGFSTVIPLSSLYSYDEDGYPTKKITTYKSSANQNSTFHVEEDYYYE